MGVRPRRISLIEVFRNKAWTITVVMEGDSDRKYRVRAERPPIKGQLNAFDGYGSKSYTEDLAYRYRRKQIHEFKKGRE